MSGVYLCTTHSISILTDSQFHFHHHITPPSQYELNKVQGTESDALSDVMSLTSLPLAARIDHPTTPRQCDNTRCSISLCHLL